MPTLAFEMTDYPKVGRDQPSRASSPASSLKRWFQLKKYQYEVTFSLYMLTSTEKLIFNLILFILVSLLVTAASLYLPSHLSIIYQRIWYYIHGEFVSKATTGGAGSGGHLAATGMKTASKTFESLSSPITATQAVVSSIKAAVKEL